MTHPELNDSRRKPIASGEQIEFIQEELRRGIAYAVLALEFKTKRLPCWTYRKQARSAHDFVVHMLAAISISEAQCQGIHIDLCTLWLLLEELGEWEERTLMPRTLPLQ